MTKRILRSIIFASIVTGLTCIVFIMGILYDYFNKSLLNELKIEAALVEQGVELYGEKDVYKRQHLRFMYLWKSKINQNGEIYE